MSAPLQTQACRLLGCDLPIVLAGMGGVARSELVGAVTLVGGFGFLGMAGEPAARIEREVAAVRAVTPRPFGVNLIPAATRPALLDEEVSACIALGVHAVMLFWTLDEKVVARFRDAGILVACQVGSRVEAQAAQQAGAGILVAQGVEAGGHVRGSLPLAKLLREVVPSSEVPVLAAGGIVDGRDLAAVLEAGAQGAVVGSAFLASPESFAHPYYKQRIVEAGAEDTVITDVFHIGWPIAAKMRVLRNSTTDRDRREAFQVPPVPIGMDDGQPVYRFSTAAPLRSTTGDLEAMALYAGKGVGRIDALMPAAARVEAMAAEAQAILAAKDRCRGSAAG
ncbi:NAD(P)H-dependent flavin oxidoreductase [Labrys monachus]|uniref:NAD(P)H-dependent flavin oxidoreductase YrpB (Nitropropane dioxygenase family) n=1 Tax=Labrys monachus TaxID=217067 RepID=A0ABU0FDY1_9HYPH|nr:nitronate monooxygenase [Labrys monachus]MDQ0392812.1 NAD(P)H-dependent flavin oxidoreductase YrpB (nitropropane dioxygenase family) [Labrys monachus]